LNCDSIARAYRWLEYLSFGRELERRRFRYLPDVACARRALVLGDGDGRFTARLVQQGTEIDYIDVSRRMLALARERAGTANVTYRHGDALTLPLVSSEYDLIASHFFFDCFEEREARLLTERVAQAARPDAKWLVSEFREPRWARLLVRGLYLFFRATTGLKTRRLIDHRPLLDERGFHLEQEETSMFGLLASELWTR
jgi:ubiquinone/menaquinone biosynthesis C-methylase UbiE